MPPRSKLARLAPQDFADLLYELDDHDQVEAWRDRLRFNRDEFCRYCFPDRFGQPFNKLHKDLFDLQEQDSWSERTESRHDVVAAPRGFAKTTVNTFAGIVHSIVYDLEACVMLLSAGLKLSLAMSTNLRSQFTTKNSRFSDLYGPFEVTGPVSSWQVSVQGRDSVAVIAASFGTDVRGTQHPTRGIRPTLVIIDDGESPDKVRNPDQRELWWNNLNKDVLKLGDTLQDRTLYRIVGTVLHQDSMLARLLKDPGWKSSCYKAIKKWPTRTDLWEKCHTIWNDLTLGNNRRTAAEGFFRANRNVMEQGAELLDPNAKSLFDLYEIIWREGMGAFLSEFQNDPIDPATQIFFSDRFVRFKIAGNFIVRADGRRVDISKLRKTLYWDPATGSVTGDFSALCVLGRDEFGYAYVIALKMGRWLPSRQLQVAWELAERWQVGHGQVESVAFSGLVTEPYQRQRFERMEKGEFYAFTLECVPQTQNKELRIAGLEPDVTNGWMQFNEDLSGEALQQFNEFPTGEHDDAPDCVQGAYEASGGRPVRMEQ